jgi:hypothetical protein
MSKNKPIIHDGLIYYCEGALKKKFCKEVIKKFDKDTRQRQGCTSSGVDTTIKDSMDMNISKYDNWKKEDKVFFDSLGKHIGKFQKLIKCQKFIKYFHFSDSGYQVQRTPPHSNGYIWHHDGMVRYNDGVLEERYLTFIWYLNDVTDDGYTEFYNGVKIQPKAGSIVLFPATWYHYHRGYPTKSQEKYLCTGWLYAPPATEGRMNDKDQDAFVMAKDNENDNDAT